MGFIKNFILLLFLIIFIPLSAQNTYVVNSPLDLEDVDLADSRCNDKYGNCTLRAAIQNANKNNNRDKVHFNIKGTGPFRISLNKKLPGITEPIVLDASTQPGYSILTPQIELCGNNITTGNYSFEPRYRIQGFFLTGRSSGSLIRGFALGGFGKKNYSLNGKILPLLRGEAIVIETHNNIIQGNYIGVAADGHSRFSNVWGIAVINSARNNWIGGVRPEERNVISGNHQVGIFLSKNTKVEGNYIGTSADGNCELGNAYGISIVYYGENNVLKENLISGNGNGIILMGENNSVIKNRIGTNIKGTGAIPNEVGIFIESGENNLIDENLISGNGIGIKQEEVHLVKPQHHRIFGNFIGTDITGTYAVPNNVGIVFTNGNFNQIGGKLPENRNLISGNLQAGVRMSDSKNNTISGNYIGTDVSGSLAVPNSVGIQLGIGKDSIINSSNNILQNVISGNNNDGIILSHASYTTLSGNYIGLAGDYVTPLPNGGSGIIIGEASAGNCVGGQHEARANLIGYNGEYGILAKNRGLQQGELPDNKLLHNKFLDNCKADISSGLDLVKKK